MALYKIIPAFIARSMLSRVLWWLINSGAQWLFPGALTMISAWVAVWNELEPTQVFLFALITLAVSTFITNQALKILSWISDKNGLGWFSKIYWDFDQFLAVGQSGNHDIKIGAFQANGKNKTGEVILTFSADICSLINGKKYPVYLVVRGEPKKFGETNGIPRNAEFQIVAPFVPVEETSLVESKKTTVEFLTQIGEFEFVAAYNDETYRRIFSRKKIQKYLEKWRVKLTPDARPGIQLKD